MVATVSKRPKSEQPAEGRKQSISAQEFKDMADFLARYSGVLQGIAEQMKEAEIESVSVLGLSNWRRGIAFLERFKTNAEKSFQDIKWARGIWK
jgi:hypothetical protein